MRRATFTVPSVLRVLILGLWVGEGVVFSFTRAILTDNRCSPSLKLEFKPGYSVISFYTFHD